MKLFKTVHSKLTLLIAVVLLVLVSLLLINNTYAIRVVHEQIARSYRHLTALNMEQRDESMQNMDQYLQTVVLSDSDFFTLGNTSDQNAAIFASIGLQESLFAALSVNSSVTSLFCLDTVSGRWIDVFKPESAYSQRSAVRDYLKGFLTSGQPLWADWRPQVIGGNYYLVRVVRAGNLYLGAWTDVSALQAPIDDLRGGTAGEILFVTADGLPMVHTLLSGAELRGDFQAGYMTRDRQYYITGQPSACGDFALVAVIQNEAILQALPTWIRLGLLLAVGILILIPLMGLALRWMIARPLDAVVSVMRRFGTGETGVRLPAATRLDEFAVVGREFNRMADRIEGLQIQVYEEQLQKQKAELQYLQLQITPHFYLNTLNTLYAFSRTQPPERVQELILLLVRYLRYMFRSSRAFTTLGEEVDHIQNYLCIQEIRYPGMISLSLDIPPELKTFTVPALCLHTFVENTVKYQVSAKRPVAIHVEAALDLSGRRPALTLRVGDNGTGYPQSVLDRVSAGIPLVDQDGVEHIGILNLLQRVAILYKNEADVRLYNADGGGAAAELRLPAKGEESTDERIDRGR